MNAEPCREGDKKYVINSKALTVSCGSFSQFLVVLSRRKRNLNQGGSSSDMFHQKNTAKTAAIPEYAEYMPTPP